MVTAKDIINKLKGLAESYHDQYKTFQKIANTLRKQRKEYKEDLARAHAHRLNAEQLRYFICQLEVNRQETIERAAILVDGDVWDVPQPGRHNDVINIYVYGMTQPPEGSAKLRSLRHFEQGFLTSTGRFVGREEALSIARAANQIIKRCGGDEDELYSENLW
jgi:hypothetical protein